MLPPCGDADPAGHQPLLHKHCTFLANNWDFCGQWLRAIARGLSLMSTKSLKDPLTAGKLAFFKARHSIGHFRWQHQRHIWIRVAAMGSMFRQHKSFYMLQIWGFMVEAGSRDSRRIRGLKRRIYGQQKVNKKNFCITLSFGAEWAGITDSRTMAAKKKRAAAISIIMLPLLICKSQKSCPSIILNLDSFTFFQLSTIIVMQCQFNQANMFCIMSGTFFFCLSVQCVSASLHGALSSHCVLSIDQHHRNMHKQAALRLFKGRWSIMLL